MKTTFPLLTILPLILAVSSCQNQQANSAGSSDSGYQDYGYVPNEKGSQAANNPYATDNTYGSYQGSAPGSAADQGYAKTTPSAGNSTQMPSYQDSVSPNPSYGSQAPAPASPSSTGLAQSHVVSQGENLYRISKMYGSTVEGIKSANSLNSNLIRPGDVLSIP